MQGHQPGSLQGTHKVPYQKPVTEQSTEHVSVSDAKWRIRTDSRFDQNVMNSNSERKKRLAPQLTKLMVQFQFTAGCNGGLGRPWRNSVKNGHTHIQVFSSSRSTRPCSYFSWNQRPTLQRRAVSRFFFSIKRSGDCYRMETLSRLSLKHCKNLCLCSNFVSLTTDTFNSQSDLLQPSFFENFFGNITVFKIFEKPVEWCWINN